jgi:hypothetical protein
LIPKLLIEEGFGLVKGLIPDNLHCLWLDIVVQFRKLWETSTDKPSNSHYVFAKIDTILFAIKPPIEILRAPRSLELFGRDWKTSENILYIFFFGLISL